MNTIAQLRDNTGNLKQEPQEILQVARDFYQDLYSPDPPQPSRRYSRVKIFSKIPKVPLEMLQDLESGITEEEVREAIKRSGRNRSPGPDGIPSEFYNTFIELTAPLLTSVYRECFHRKGLPPSLNEALMTLIYKKGDEAEIKNYRPISLLNVDLKILTKVLSNRLSQVLPVIIHRNQKQVKGRNILDNARLMFDLIYYLSNTRSKAAILFLDQEKAFDRLNWDFLKGMLRAFGFGENFRRWIDIIYNQPTIRIKINNWISEKVEIQRGVRQGDPLSPLLYTLCIEGLACLIRDNQLLTGVPIASATNLRLKILLYADDAAIFLPNLDQMEALRETLEIFEAASDARINWSKSEALLFGIKKPPDGFWKGKWLEPKEITRYLGVPLSRSLNLEDLWSTSLKDILSTTDRWTRHHLTLMGRRTVLQH